MKWNFIKYPLGMTIRDSTAGEFFSVDAIDKSAQGLIREGIQNSMDARIEKGKPLRIRIFLGQIDNPDSAKVWFEGAWLHYDADDKLESKPKPNDPISYLVFEDFGTTGLQGNTEQTRDLGSKIKNPFFYFFRAEGRSGKGEQDRGRWGVGKHVFAQTSRVKTFWGFTVRNDDKKKLLMGRSILRSRLVDDDFYSPDGYFGQENTNDLTLPLSDPKILNQFSIDFNLARKDEPGLSVVVPYIDEEIALENIQSAVTEEYFYPIVKGDLEVIIETTNESLQINSATFLEISNGRLPILDIVRKSLENLDRDLFILNPCNSQKPSWYRELIPADMLINMREKYQKGEILALQPSLTIRPKFGEEKNAFFRVFIKQDKDESGKVIFIRKGLIISRVKAPQTRGVQSLVVIEDEPLAKLLGDSENPAHTEWQKSNIKDKYINATAYIEFVANIVSNLVNTLSVEENTVDDNLILDIFSLPLTNNEEQPKRTTEKKGEKPGTVTKPPLPPPPPRENKFILSQVKGGFSVTSGSDKLSFPLRLEVRVAYDVRKGSALGRYNISDFRLDQPPVKIKKPYKGLQIIKIRENMILANITKDDFELLVTGFDENRDLYVKVKIDEGNND
jgi:disulfide oxidoreductase YuzD